MCWCDPEHSYSLQTGPPRWAPRGDTSTTQTTMEEPTWARMIRGRGGGWRPRTCANSIRVHAPVSGEVWASRASTGATTGAHEHHPDPQLAQPPARLASSTHALPGQQLPTTTPCWAGSRRSRPPTPPLCSHRPRAQHGRMVGTPVGGSRGSCVLDPLVGWEALKSTRRLVDATRTCPAPRRTHPHTP